MKHFLKKLAAILENSLGLNRLSKDFKKFALMHTTYCIFQAMVSSYIITLLMRVTGDGDIVLWYNFINFIFHGISVILGVFIIRKGSVNLTVRIAILCFIALYTVLLLTMAQADAFMIVFAFLNGAANALYWLAYAAYFSNFTEDHGRDAALGFMGFINGVTALVMPALSGFMIETIGKYAGTFVGYAVVFALSFIVAIVAIVLTFRLPKEAADHAVEKRTYFREAFRTIFHDTCWKCGMACESFRGLRDGTLNFLMNLLLFDIVQSETLIGINSLLASIGTIVSFWLAGRILRPSNRIKSMFIGSSVLLVASSLLAINLNPATIMIFAALNTFFNTFIVNPSNGIMFLIVQKKSAPHMANEYLSIRDMFLCIGRMCSVTILMFFPRVQFGYVIAIVILTMSQFILVGLSRLSTRLLREMDAAPKTAETSVQ